jgi:putative flippase GtrA
MAGTVGFVVDSGVLYLCVRLFGWDPYSGRALSFLAAATTTWALNRRFTFRNQTPRTRLPGQYLRYLLGALTGGSVNYATYAGLVYTSVWVQTYLIVGVAVGSLAGMVVNFAVSKWWVFRRAEGGKPESPSSS